MINNGKGVYTEIMKSRLHVMAPYTDDLVLVAHQLGARWRKRSGIWSFNRLDFARVATALNRIYGTSIKTHVLEDM